MHEINAEDDGDCMSLNCDANEYNPICGGLDAESSTGFLNRCALMIYNCLHGTGSFLQFTIRIASKILEIISFLCLQNLPSKQKLNATLPFQILITVTNDQYLMYTDDIDFLVWINFIEIRHRRFCNQLSRFVYDSKFLYSIKNDSWTKTNVSQL